jgi:hypothetical protein
MDLPHPSIKGEENAIGFVICPNHKHPNRGDCALLLLFNRWIDDEQLNAPLLLQTAFSNCFSRGPSPSASPWLFGHFPPCCLPAHLDHEELVLVISLDGGKKNR